MSLEYCVSCLIQSLAYTFPHSLWEKQQKKKDYCFIDTLYSLLVVIYPRQQVRTYTDTCSLSHTLTVGQGRGQ